MGYRIAYLDVDPSGKEFITDVKELTYKQWFRSDGTFTVAGTIILKDMLLNSQREGCKVIIQPTFDD